MAAQIIRGRYLKACKLPTIILSRLFAHIVSMRMTFWSSIELIKFGQRQIPVDQPLRLPLDIHSRKPIKWRYDPRPKSRRNVVDTKKRHEDIGDMQRHERKDGRPRQVQILPFKLPQRTFASWQRRASETSLRSGNLMERVVITTTVQVILNHSSARFGKVSTPGEVEFMVKRKGGLFVTRVADGEEGYEAWPEE